MPAYDIHTLLPLVVFFLSLLVTLLLHFIFFLLLLLFLFKCPQILNTSQHTGFRHCFWFAHLWRGRRKLQKTTQLLMDWWGLGIFSRRALFKMRFLHWWGLGLIRVLFSEDLALVGSGSHQMCSQEEVLVLVGAGCRQTCLSRGCSCTDGGWVSSDAPVTGKGSTCCSLTLPRSPETVGF